MTSLFVSGLIFSLLPIMLPTAKAQSRVESRYLSSEDRDITIRTLGLAPVTDNMDGIYAKTLSDDLREYFGKDLRMKSKSVTLDIPLADLESQAPKVMEILKSNAIEGLLVSRVIKGPSGLQIRLILFSGPQGAPLLVEESSPLEQFETAIVRDEFSSMLRRLLSRMPYQGFLASRRGLEVTLSMGSDHGVNTGDDISVIQILKVHRHPKHGFMVGSEKEILGKLKVLKSDQQMSFAQVTFEKDPGLLEAGMKIQPDRFVQYPVASGPAANPMIGDRKDAPVAFGKNPGEWLPEGPPQYGRFGVLAGLGPASQSVSFAGAGTEEGTSAYAPSLGVQLEGWLNKDWFVGVDLRQSVYSVGNTLATSAPSKLNMSTSRYDLWFGRNFLLSPDFFGPRLLFSVGYAQYRTQADDSTPLLFGNMSYSGMRLGFDFTTPLTDELPWEMGGRFRYYLWPTVSESVRSGNVDSIGMNEFAFTVGYRVRERVRYLGEAVFYYENSEFSGQGERTQAVNKISHRSTVLALGLEYLF